MWTEQLCIVGIHLGVKVVFLACSLDRSFCVPLRYRIPGFYSSHHCNLASQPSAAVGGVCNGTHETICKLHILSHGSEPDGAELGLTLQDLARGIEVVSCMGLEQVRRHSHDRSRQRTGQIHLPPFPSLLTLVDHENCEV